MKNKMKLGGRKRTNPAHKIPAQKNSLDSDRRNAFPIVGIGASAGGLEAFIQLLSKVPVDTGMAFVLVQHLDPTHASLSAEIISRSTKMEIQEVVDGMRVSPNHIYVIPPNHKMGIIDGRLRLSPRTMAEGKHMTIDFFFQALAKAKGSGAIGVVLSGSGSDGTNGLEAIKASGGITFAQEPSTAKYEAMPRHAIVAGVADFVLAPEDIAKEFSRLSSRRSNTHEGNVVDEDGFATDVMNSNRSDENLQKIFRLLRSHSNVDFSNYKYATIARRIHRRVMAQKLKGLKAYTSFLDNHPDEVKALFDDILIHVTEFFRDPESFEALKTQVFQRLVENRSAGTPIRVWVPGCSTGEEAYSIAISLMEFLEEAGLKIQIQIFATDICEKAIQTARAGQYSENIAHTVSKDRLKNFFYKEDGGYRIHKVVRDACLFSVHDVTRDPPFAKLDLVSCRNVLIYFGPVLQRRVIPIFHYALTASGFLWVGKSETPGEFSKLFNLVEKGHKIYAKANVRTPIKFHFPVKPRLIEAQPAVREGPTHPEPEPSVQSVADKIILKKFSPPGVIVNVDLDILELRGRIGRFLEPALRNNLLKMARPELLAGLRKLMESVKKENRPVQREGLRIEVDGVRRTVNIDALPTNPSAAPHERTYLVLFVDVPTPKSKADRRVSRGKKGRASRGPDPKDRQITELSQELLEAKESQDALVEQFDAAQEALTTSNEELQSTNEEFQSTNEELETAKEELQSTNEELVTVNDELQIRNNDLSVLGSDLSNLLSSTEIPILMVGKDRRIRRFTPKAEAAFNLQPSDVGRPIGDIKSNFGLDLDALILDLMVSLQPIEMEVQDRQGAWRRLQIRPYRTVDDKFDGAIVALIDIEDLKQREKSSKEAFDYIKSISDTVPLPLVVLNGDFQVKSVNHAFYKNFLISHDILGKDIFAALDIRGDYVQRLSELFHRAINANASFSDFEIDCDFPRIGRRKVLLSGREIQWRGAEAKSILLSFADVTEQRRIEEERHLWLVREQEARNEAEKANRAKDVFLATLSHELRTPLASILTWAQLIRMGKVDLEKARQGASIIEQSAKAQSQLIEDLLDISRIIAGKLSLKVSPVDPAAVIRAALESVRPMADKKSIVMEAVLSAEPKMILGDTVRLQQILWNLLVNAIKFSPNGGQIEVHLEFVGSQAKPFAQIKIIDHGKGIRPEFLPHMFDRFSQADGASTRLHGGLGLGLSIVRNLVELQGGTVRAESHGEGHGAMFTVEFPLLAANSAIMPSAQADPVVAMESLGLTEKVDPKLDGLRVLCVDDDESTCEAISIYLRSFGAEVLPATSAIEALKALPAFRPHVLVSDIAMPGEDGYTLIRKIRELGTERGGNVPALALTAYVSPEDTKRVLSAGFQAHLAKPVEAGDLGRMILKFAKPH